MSFDFFPEEQAENIRRIESNPATNDAGIWKNFFPGAAKTTMQGFAEAGRAIDLLGAVPPMIQDRLTGGTTAQDTYFKEHDDVFNNAVDYWTPRPGEVGTAGRVTGSLISGLTQFVASPALAIGTAQLGTGESLVREGIDSTKAQEAGLVSGLTLGAGMYLPILGKTAVSKIITGVAGNVGLGIGGREAQHLILEDTHLGKNYNPWDAEGLIVDSLMGAAFGGFAHLTAKPEIKPSEADAILTLNQARHLEDTTAPGIPKTPQDLTAHVEAIKKAVDDLLNGRDVNIEQLVHNDEFTSRKGDSLIESEIGRQSREILVQKILDDEARSTALEKPGFLRTAEDLVAMKQEDISNLHPELQDLINIARKPGFQRVAEEKIKLDAALAGKGLEHLTPSEIIQKTALEPVNEKVADPIVYEAHQRLQEHPDIADTIISHTQTIDGKPIDVKLSDYMDVANKEVTKAEADSNLFAEAARCLMGEG